MQGKITGADQEFVSKVVKLVSKEGSEFMQSANRSDPDLVNKLTFAVTSKAVSLIQDLDEEDTKKFLAFTLTILAAHKIQI